MMSSSSALTSTSYAILGLLAIKPWSTYELAQQMARSFDYFWSRAERNLYDEPKKLVRHGLATASRERVGRRPRTTYKITPAGRRALARWLLEPGAPPALESEQLLKVFFGEHATREESIANIRGMKDWAERLRTLTVEGGREYREGAGPFPERFPQLLLVGNFLSGFAEMTSAWADWALEVLELWPAFPQLTQEDRAALMAAFEDDGSLVEDRRRVLRELRSRRRPTTRRSRSR